MTNKQIANIFYETALLLEVRGDDVYRIRSYRRAAEAIEAHPEPISTIIHEAQKVLEIPGIGKGMLANMQEMIGQGKLELHEELKNQYHPSMLELMKISGLGPKTVALLWDAYKVKDLESLEQLARAGKLRELPRLSEKTEQRILKGIEEYRRVSGRFLLDVADEVATQLIDHLGQLPGVEKVTPAGSLRRGRETVGDLDILLTGSCCQGKDLGAVLERVTAFPGIQEVLAQGDNKVSLRLRRGMQMDVRLLPPESFGAAMQYFTGSKMHNVALRQRALKLGYTLNEYGLVRMQDGKRVAGKSEEEIYLKLDLQYIPPELRENCGEIEAAAAHALPDLITLADIQGDVHMHTAASDGKCTIEEMIEAARQRGYKYMAITDHSKNLAMVNGLDDQRAGEQTRQIREIGARYHDIKVFAGIEVDILQDGSLDLSDSVLEQMDLVIASIHSYFKQDSGEKTDRLLRAIGNQNVSIIGHPTGRLLLRREEYDFDRDAVLKEAAKNNVAMEHNAYTDRLDLSDRHLRRAKELGVKIVINTDAHTPSHLDNMKFGVLQLRRAWLTQADVLNTLSAAEFAKAMKRSGTPVIGT